MLDIALLDTKNIPLETRDRYDASLHKASECTECGSCEAKCPFSVQVIENMHKAVSLFE